jgi:hypothetical protein
MESGQVVAAVGDRPIFNMAKSIWRTQFIDTSSLDRQRRRIDRARYGRGGFCAML